MTYGFPEELDEPLLPEFGDVLLLEFGEVLLPELLAGSVLLPLLVSELEPLLLPPTPLFPPVAAPGCTPNAEKTSCRQLGCEMSGQLLWVNVGALSNLVLSPVNTKETCSVLEGVAAVPTPAMPEGRMSCQGTATSFSVEPEYEITAKSILPEPGLMMTSSILPRSCPEEVLISEPFNLLARIP